MATITLEDVMFYTNYDPHEPVCPYITSKNREFIQLIDFIHAPDFEDIDWDVHMARYAALLGTSVTQTEHMFVIKDVLGALPNFKSLCLELGHLDKQHLFAACEPVFALPREYTRTIDERLTAYLTPKRQGQVLPSARSIKKRVKQWVDELVPPPADSPLPDVEVRVQHTPDGTFIDGRFPTAIGQEIHEILSTTAKTHNITLAEALVQLLRGAITAKVVFHLYGTDDGVFLNEEPLMDDELAAWRERATHTYRPDDRLRAYIQGRDGTCRFPGCNVPARRCDIDHVIPFPQGPTTPDNLHCLCRHHHNLKTERKVHPTLQPDGSVMWTFPSGPLANLRAA
ncbi:HNH endonuclease signature motif containing protein [Corynebacterium sp. H130]|uniref:HNH endonuclease signature motif containing protein n=1 Tax=Corynebacterium sp. H130 TaxID=3133444 RepID=UPI003099C363